MSTLERKLMWSFQIVLFTIILAAVATTNCIRDAKQEIIQTIQRELK